MRDWIYRVLTDFADYIANLLGNNTTWRIQWLLQQADRIEQARLDAMNYVNNLMQNAPWPFSEALIWFWSLVNNYIITPIFDSLRNVFNWPAQFIASFFNYSRMNYPWGYWLEDIVYNFRDRILNAWDGLVDFSNSVYQAAVGLVSQLNAAISPLISYLYAWKDSLSQWIGQNLYWPLQDVISRLAAIPSDLAALIMQIRSVTDNPLLWIWEHLSPYLYEKVIEWIQENWYVSR